MNNIYKNLTIFFISAPMLFSTSLKADGVNESDTSTDMVATVNESSGASEYDSDDDTGASAYHYVDATGSLIGENPINRAEVYTGIYNNGKTGEDQYSDARVVLEAGLGANAMCSPCGSSIELFEIQSGGNESSRFISYQSERHSFNGDVNMTDSSGNAVYGVAESILENETDIATNTTGIPTNTTDIATNTTGVSTNTTDIATNTTNIATNTAGIATNGLNISTNTNGIASNLALIGTNTSSIQSLSTSFTNFQMDTSQNFATLSSNTHRGLAEVTAISNVAYASSGWRASIGYGSYESKSATAIGVSFAGENAKFKISTSGDAMGMGISFDF